MRARAADAAARAGLDLGYLTVGLVTAILGFCVWVTMVTVTLSLLVFVVGLPLFLLSALVFRWTVELDRRNAALALGRPLRGSYRDHGGEGFFPRLASTARDPQTWKDLAWLVLHSGIGFAFGLVALIVVGGILALLTMPVWFWAVSGGPDVGNWHVDTLGKALLCTVAALPLSALGALLLRGMALGESWLARLLLEGMAGANGPAGVRAASFDGATATASGQSADGAVAVHGTPAASMAPPRPQVPLAAHAAISATLAAVVTGVWAAAGGGYFWPAWVWLGLAIPLGLHAGLGEALRLERERRAFAIQAVISIVLVGTVIVVWALAGFGTFWPVWTILAVVAGFALHGLAALLWRRVFPDARERELSERVDELTRTRRGALDVQAAELRRIERDLHDGAQARLVSLSMQLGRAEADLADRPEAAALVRQARADAGAAIAELRDLSRGIAPPVLVDRGLPAAVEALGRRAAIPVGVAVEVDRRPPPAVETAAYFVVAESLTNVAKHAPESEARVAIVLDEAELRLAVADDGPGGADPAGGGLRGLRQRVEALDGTLLVQSPAGRGTTIEVAIPCA
jgi:signal transduction histidine kinase